MSDDQKQGAQDTFISHLIELRSRLVKAAFGVLLVFLVLFVAWPGPSAIFDIVAKPMIDALPAGSRMISTGVVAPFLVPFKLTLLAAFVIALPWVLYQAWAFVAPGLYAHEKKLVAPLVISSSLLFCLGVAFCYFFVFGKVFRFIGEFAPRSIAIAPDMENYLDFVITMCLAFGLTFEVPVVVVVLVRMGVISVERLKSVRRYVIVGAFAVAAAVTPPDLFSMLFLAIPLCLLYEIGLLVAPMFVRLTRAPEETT
jgi:sec-independent protein translocase protein TatC